MIGLIFGDTDFPKKILKKVKKSKKRYLIIDLTRNNYFKKNKFSKKVSLGQFGKILKILKENKCSQVLFAGKVNKPNFSKIRLDFKGFLYIPRIIKKAKIGDAAILKEIIKILHEEKIKTLSSIAYNPELTLDKGNYSRIKPNKEDVEDIKKGISILNTIGKYNSTQAIVIRNKKIIALEGKEGTEKMLTKCKSNKINPKGVLVKFPKKKQDLRIDLPALGYKTITQCKLAGLKGVVLKRKQHIILEKKKCISFINKNQMFLKVI
jgi:UDP-2,3-diacylglucosamine hydrolase